MDGLVRYSLNADETFNGDAQTKKLAERCWRGGGTEAERGLLMDGGMSEGENDA